MFCERSFRFSFLLRNCVPLSAIFQAKQVHAQVLVHGFISHTTLQTDIIFVYSRGDHLQDARKVFDKMSERNMHSWNILIASYVHNSMYYDALGLFDEFRNVGFHADHYTLPQIFKVCAGTGNAYLGLGRAGFYEASLSCFMEMIGDGVKIDSMTLPSVLNSLAGYGDLMKGKEVHSQVLKNLLFDSDVAISNALIDMYAKCGFLKGSENVFFSMKCLNLVTWTTMISCYAIHGKGEKSLRLFEKMKDNEFKPNCVTLTAILASCSHAGLINQGWRIFKSMNSEFDIEPMIEHYACMVDLLGRCGYLNEALGLIEGMNFTANASIWGALLSGCVMHKNTEIGEIAAHKLFELEPENPSNYVALCSIYNTRGLFNRVSRVRRKMRTLGVVKVPGWSCINNGGIVRIFYQGDRSNPRVLKVAESLDKVMKSSISAGKWRLGNNF